MGVRFVPVANVYGQGVCESCGQNFTKSDYRQRVCKKDCGRYRKPNVVRFCGVDGEGLGSDPSKYVLFGVGDRHVENIDGLSWKEVFDFLYREFERRGKGVAFVGFYLGYDFTQILKSLPEDRARMLLTSEGRARRAHKRKGREPHPVECEGWQFDILGSKRLRIRPKLCRCRFPSCKCKKAPWCFLCDVGGFWQTSFLNVIDPKGWGDHPVVSGDEYELIRVGKARRASATLDDDMRRYMHLENAKLEIAMSTLADGFESSGVHLSAKQWFGPGQAAAAWMRGKISKREVIEAAMPAWYRDAARASYFGGWFEIFMHGHIGRKVWEYDINSAYPSIIATLPCLEHGRYTSGTGIPGPNSHGYMLVRARVHGSDFGKSRHPRNRNAVGTMLHRNPDGSIVRPNVSEGWYWLDELESARRAGTVDKVDYREWVNYEPCDCPPPFAGIADLYQNRLRVGKNTPQGKAAKLLYNSCYGKFAQSVGNPQYGNPVYASLITSGCRKRILDAIGSHPDGVKAVAMVATDAVFFLRPHGGLPLSNRLGEWECTKRDGLTIFKPGVYWDDETRRQIRAKDKPKFKARGINAEEFAKQIWRVDAAFSAWRNDGEEKIWPDVEFMSGFSMVTALQALMWNRWEDAGKNIPKPIFHTSVPHKKREGLWWDADWQVWRSNVVQRGWNWETGDWQDVHSVGYEKRFGMDDPFSDESREAYGVTEDGYAVDAFRYLLRNEE